MLRGGEGGGGVLDRSDVLDIMHGRSLIGAGGWVILFPVRTRGLIDVDVLIYIL